MSNMTNLIEITKEEFLTARLAQECGKKDELDKAATCTLLNHLKHRGQKYYRATLTEQGFQNLIIAYHHHNVDEMVKVGGQPLHSIVEKYTASAPHNECWQKVNEMKGIIAREIQRSGNIFPETMMPFVADVGNLAVNGEGHYKQYSSECLYIGGYHRFAAFGLWVRENNFRPLDLYYCEATGTAR